MHVFLCLFYIPSFLSSFLLPFLHFFLFLLFFHPSIHSSFLFLFFLILSFFPSFFPSFLSLLSFLSFFLFFPSFLPSFSFFHFRNPGHLPSHTVIGLWGIYCWNNSCINFLTSDQKLQFGTIPEDMKMIPYTVTSPPAICWEFCVYCV